MLKCSSPGGSGDAGHFRALWRCTAYPFNRLVQNAGLYHIRIRWQTSMSPKHLTFEKLFVINHIMCEVRIYRKHPPIHTVPCLATSHHAFSRVNNPFYPFYIIPRSLPYIQHRQNPVFSITFHRPHRSTDSSLLLQARAVIAKQLDRLPYSGGVCCFYVRWLAVEEVAESEVLYCFISFRVKDPGVELEDNMLAGLGGLMRLIDCFPDTKARPQEHVGR
jgi:hypothetical protein